MNGVSREEPWDIGAEPAFLELPLRLLVTQTLLLGCLIAPSGSGSCLPLPRTPSLCKPSPGSLSLGVQVGSACWRRWWEVGRRQRCWTPLPSFSLCLDSASGGDWVPSMPQLPPGTSCCSWVLVIPPPGSSRPGRGNLLAPVPYCGLMCPSPSALQHEFYI